VQTLGRIQCQTPLRVWRHFKVSRHLCNQFPEFDAFRPFVTQALALIFFVIGVSAFEEIYLRITFKSQDMCCNPVEEPPVVRDNHGASRKVFEAFFQRAECVYVNIIGRLIQEQNISF